MRLYGSRRKLAESIIQESVRQAVSQSSGSGGGITALTGDVTASGSGSVAATIAADAVTYAKMQNVSAASRLLGRGSAAGAGDVQELTLGTGLSLSGTVLSATGTGDVVGPASATDNAVARFDLTTGKLIQNSAVTIADTGAMTIAAGSSVGLTVTNTGLSGQANFRYDTSNYLNIAVYSNGATRFKATGASPSLLLESVAEISASATLAVRFGSGAEVLFTAPYFQFINSASTSNYLNVDVSAAGVVTYDAVGASASHVFSDSVQATEYRVSGTKVVGAQGATISDPTGGTVQDSEARTAINTIIDRLQAHGLIA